MDEHFKVKHLLADELTYELGRPEEYFLSLHDAEYDHDTEVQAIEDTLESIRAILAEFEGTAEDMIFKRLRTRLKPAPHYADTYAHVRESAACVDIWHC
jgi:hypothetical protein